MINNKTIEDMNNRRLDSYYIIIYAFKIKAKVKIKNSIYDKFLYSFVAVDNLGKRKFLNSYIENQIDNRFWLDQFEQLKARKIKNRIVNRFLDNIYQDSLIGIALTIVSKERKGIVSIHTLGDSLCGSLSRGTSLSIL